MGAVKEVKEVNEKKAIVSNNKSICETALYIRVSTDAQYEEGYSIEAQKKKLKQWCEMKDITDFELYIDGGFSGSNIDRPEMKRLIENIRNRLIKNVVVYKLDRLSRSQKDTVFLLEDVFIPNNANFISLNENFDTTTPYGKAMIGILSVFAQLERENIRERTRMGMLERVKSGLWMGGGKTPFGYDYNMNTGLLVPNEQAEKVIEIYDLYLQGYSTTKLAAMFGFKGDKQITDMLDRETYMGLIRFNGELIKGLHAPLIDGDTWQKVREEREKRSTKNAAASSYLLTGLVYCGKCGAKMRYQKWGKTSIKIYCYSQQTTKKYLIKDPDCDNEKVEAGDLEELVIKDLFRIADETANENSVLVNRTSAIDVLKQKYNITAGKIKRLYNLYSLDGDEILLSTINELKSELNKLSSDIENEKKISFVESEIKQKQSLIKDLNASWGSLSLFEKQRILRLYIERIDVVDNNVDVVYAI